MLKITLNPRQSAEFNRLFKQAPLKVSQGIKAGLRRCGDQMRNEAGTDAPYDTGNLKRSITMKMYGDKKVVVGSNLVYARIHDEGGVIYPKRKKFLYFQIGGKWVAAKKVRIKKYKGRGYLTPAFEKLAGGDAAKIFTEEINRLLK